MSLNRRQFVGSAGLAAGVAPLGALAEEAAGFMHGVASGDPLADRVILWSRVSGYEGAPEVSLQIALTPSFDQPLQTHTLTTTAERDFTVKADISGLSPGTVYYYRFFTARHASAVGRTRTLPADSAERVRLAVVSCSNYPAGFFNVYRALGNYNDLDAVIHLGDYIYEYAVDGYASARAKEFGRLSQPPGEVDDLTDYRQRYAQYRSDPDLQYVHSRVPFIAIWDDHEIANDAWSAGAQNHSSDQGSYPVRKREAMRAYYEWLPVREPESRPLDAAFRHFQFGKIASLAMIENRLSGRDEPLSRGSAMSPKTVWYDLSRRREPKRLDRAPLADDQRAVELPAIARIQGRTSIEITDYQEHKALAGAASLPAAHHYIPDREQFFTRLNEPRAMLGETQLNWLQGTFDQSHRDNTSWQILGNQTLLSEVTSPNLQAALSPEEVARLPGYIQGLVPLSQYDVPINLDSWDGYPEARQRLYDHIESPSSLITLAGDTHNAWAGPLTNARTGRYAGYELATPSVSSPGLPETLGIEGQRVRDLLAGVNPQFDYLQMSHRGYVVLDLTADDATARFHYVNRIDQRRFFVMADDPLSIPRT